MTVLNLSSLRTGRFARACACSALLALPIFSAEGCNKKKPVVVLAQQSNPDEIEITPALASHLKLGTPQTHEVTGLLQVSAHVETDASRIARVGSPVAGRILKLVVFEGQSVRPGTVLATLHSTDLSDAQLALVKAYSQKNLAETATKRAEQLVAADVIGRAELERRQAELLQASTEAASYRTRRRMMSVSAHDRIAGRPSRAKVLEEFIIYAQSHPGVAFMRKDDIARFAMENRLTVRESI
jgi:membrane fusion protein, heavy metal efflux system